jgi:hypothetical protein
MDGNLKWMEVVVGDLDRRDLKSWLTKNDTLSVFELAESMGKKIVRAGRRLNKMLQFHSNSLDLALNCHAMSMHVDQ